LQSFRVKSQPHEFFGSLYDRQLRVAVCQASSPRAIADLTAAWAEVTGGMSNIEMYLASALVPQRHA
jgi:hypothetical protein